MMAPPRLCRWHDSTLRVPGVWWLQLHLAVFDPKVVLSTNTAYADLTDLSDPSRTMLSQATYCMDEERTLAVSRMLANVVSNASENWRVIDGLALGVVGVTPHSPELEVLLLVERWMMLRMSDFVVTHIWVMEKTWGDFYDLVERQAIWQPRNGIYSIAMPGRVHPGKHTAPWGQGPLAGLGDFGFFYKWLVIDLIVAASVLTCLPVSVASCSAAAARRGAPAMGPQPPSRQEQAGPSITHSCQTGLASRLAPRADLPASF